MFQPQKPAGGTAPGVEEGRKLLGGRYLMKNNINYFLPSVNLTLAYILFFKKKTRIDPIGRVLSRIYHFLWKMITETLQ